MKRSEVLLAILAAANGGYYTPVQLQKAVFLLDDNLPDIFDKNSKFNFVPHNYGPFDSAVYTEADALRKNELAIIQPGPSGSWNIYFASPKGIIEGNKILNALPKYKEYIITVSEWVRKLSFQELVSSIYKKYPHMKTNSIFQE